MRHYYAEASEAALRGDQGNLPRISRDAYSSPPVRLARLYSAKDHCSLYPGSAVMDAHKGELKRYDTSKGTIRFPANKPLPAALVKKLVKARIEQNEARAAAKNRRRGDRS